jgi:hypothetical protein
MTSSFRSTSGFALKAAETAKAAFDPEADHLDSCFVLAAESLTSLASTKPKKGSQINPLTIRGRSTTGDRRDAGQDAN